MYYIYNFDAETGTIYLRARYYNPTTGRFISRDSFAGRNSDPLSLNRYTYCRNNSIIFIDPSGYSYGTLPDGTKFSINSASDAKKFAELKSGKASSSQVQTTTAITTQVSTITGGLAVPATNTTTYTTTAKYDSGPFSSADNAALAFAKSTYSSSLYIRHEYSAIIYSKKSNNQNKSTSSRIIISRSKINSTCFSIKIFTAVTERISIGLINILLNTKSIISIGLCNTAVFIVIFIISL